MRAGTLREKIMIQRQQPGRDAWGERTAWMNVGSHAASVQPTASSEGTAAEGTETIGKYTIRIRYSAVASTISTTDRILWRGTTIDITGITPNERRTEILITGVAHG